MIPQRAIVWATAFCLLSYSTLARQQPSTNLGKDANGNSLRLAVKTGHISNYDESKVKPYTLPDPLLLANGKRVRDAQTWTRERRPEILRLYETEIFGRIPPKTPKVSWETVPIRGFVSETTMDMTLAIGKIGDAADAPKMNVTLYMPAQARAHVPVILLLNFGGGGAAVAEPPVAADIIAHGWGYVTVGYQDIQPDKINTFDRGVIGAMGRAPAADEWGAIGAWAWGVSRVIDYLQTDRRVDPKRIALHGHSRLGKTALWASALDDRIAAVYASCPGEMGAALSRRDFGETVDDMAQNFPYWFAGNFQKWVGRWNDMPVDAHMLIALSAPRPVFITGGTQDQWADPIGEFLAEVAAGPVYRLLGKHDLGADRLPPLDTALIGGDLAWHYHTGPHAATEADWRVFVRFLEKYFAA
jgi:dienelactone hydrolase